MLKMRKMKDSGIEWIGEIPEGWEIHRMKSCISQRDGGAWGDEATGETGDCICLRIADFDYEHFRFTDSNNLTIRHYASPIIKKLLLQKNDILIEKSGGGEKTPVGRTVLFDKEYPALFANFMDRLRCSDFVHPQYLQYVFVTFYKNRYTQNYIKQTTGIQNLDLSSMLADEFVPVPNLNEQKLIVCYLESKCSKIDNLLSKIRSSIEEYKKLKQAVITQAVTKGVRGEREMKDSGVEWIGEIPKEWVIQKIKSISSRINVGVVIRPSEYFDENGTVPFLRGINVKEYLISSNNMVYINESSNHILSKSQVHTDDILIVRDGSIGTSCVVPAEYDGANVVSMVIVTPSISCDSRFTCYSLNSDVGKTQFTLTKIGSALTHTSVSAVSDIIVAVPSCTEQKEIAAYLDAKCAEIDKLIAKKERLVKELESYKKSLIYEVVTGKREG